MYIPDVVLYDEKSNVIVLVEGKKLSTLQEGLREINNYDSIEEEYIKPNYPKAKIIRCVSIFGGNKTGNLDKNVLIYMNSLGKVYINPQAPNCIKMIAATEGI